MATGALPTVPTTYPYQLQSIPNVTIPVAIHTKCHQLAFNSCWNECGLHDLFPNTNHIACCHLEFAYQFILSSRQSPGINLRSVPFNFPIIPSTPPLFLSYTIPGCTSPKLSHGAVFTLCSCTFTLFRWSKFSVKHPCVYACLSLGDLFIISVRVSSFFSYFRVSFYKSISRKLTSCGVWVCSMWSRWIPVWFLKC